MDKIQALDNFYEIDGYSYPKESQGVAEDTTDDLLNMRQDDPRIKRNQDITALAKEIYAQMVAERGQPMDRRQQQTWMAIAQTKAAAQLSNTAAQNESQGVAEGLTEMDKSQTPPGRDTGPRSGPDQYVKPITSKQMQDRALDKLNQAVKDSHKKKDVKESDTLMMKLKRAMVREGRVKELADDLKTMPDTDFMKKYGKAKAAIRADMKRVDEAGISRLGKKDFDFR